MKLSHPVFINRFSALTAVVSSMANYYVWTFAFSSCHMQFTMMTDVAFTLNTLLASLDTQVWILSRR